MSFQSLADVFAYVQNHDDLTTNEVIVLLAIANHADHAGTNAYPTLATLQRITKLSRRAIQYALQTLRKRLTLDYDLQPGRHGRQTYALLLPHVSLQKGAPHAPYGEEKGAPHAPYGEEKGAPHAPEKVHHMHPDPILIQQPEEKDSARAPEERQRRERLLEVLGCPPDSPAWHACMNGYLTPGQNEEAC